MPWDTDLIADYVEVDPPQQLVELLSTVIEDDDLRVESVAIARKKRAEKHQKPSASYLQFAKYMVDEGETLDDICNEVMAAAYAAAEIDGELGTPKFQACVVWVDRATGKKDRNRITFDLDESKRRSAHTPPSGCPGCLAYRETGAYLRSQVHGLQREVRALRNEASSERERAETLVSAERSARDGLVKDLAKIGTDAAKDAREAYRPTQESTNTIIGMLSSAVAVYESAVNAQGAHAKTLVEERSALHKRELVGQTIKIGEKLLMQIIKAKFKGKTDDDDEDDKTTAMQKLNKVRDQIFSAATKADWDLLEKVIGSKFVEGIRSMAEGDVDIDKLDKLLDDFGDDATPKQLKELLLNLSEGVSDAIMQIGDAVKAAKKERDEA